jgi:hypothetical protein
LLLILKIIWVESLILIFKNIHDVSSVLKINSKMKTRKQKFLLNSTVQLLHNLSLCHKTNFAVIHHSLLSCCF